MYCATCGSMLEDGSKFCNACGAPQPVMSQQTVMPQQTVMSQQTVMPVPVTKEKKSKKGLVIGIVSAVVVVALVLLTIFVIVPKVKDAKKSPRLKALDRYYAAIEDTDLAALEKEVYPPIIFKDGYHIYNASQDYYSMMLRYWGIYPGFLMNDYFKSDKAVMDRLYQDYPLLNPDYYGGYNEIREKLYIDEEACKNLFKESGLSIDYVVMEMKHFDEVSLRTPRGDVVDMDHAVRIPGTEDEYLDVDDMYVARVHMTWYYGDKQYGYNEAWWSDPVLKDKLEQYGKSYDDVIVMQNKLSNVLVIYKYGGEWYVYPPVLTNTFFYIGER